LLFRSFCENSKPIRRKPYNSAIRQFDENGPFFRPSSDGRRLDGLLLKGRGFHGIFPLIIGGRLAFLIFAIGFSVNQVERSGLKGDNGSNETDQHENLSDTAQVHY
jgi:hypothetical protein